MFLSQINTIIDWTTTSKIIDVDCSKDKRAAVNHLINGLLLFKMDILHSWYD